MDGGGVLMNQGIHIIDLLLWFVGDPVEVHAFADSRHRSVEIEDTAGAVLRFANGTVATITATRGHGTRIPPPAGGLRNQRRHPDRGRVGAALGNG